MGEEGSNLNETESQPQPLATVPEEHSSVQEKESDIPQVVNQEPANQQLTPPPGKKDTDVADHDGKKDTGDSIDRDAGLAKIVAEKRLALIKAWEESEKTKAENRAYKNHSAVGSWEESKKASIEAQLKKIEENLERKKAEYVEKKKNKVAEIHQSAEEKRAIVEAKKKEEFLEIEETAAKFRIRGVTPKKFFGCLSG